MKISIIPIGDAKGILIPKNILEKLKITKEVELELHNKEILIKPVENKTRIGWKKAFAKMHKNGEDKLLIYEFEDQTGNSHTIDAFFVFARK